MADILTKPLPVEAHWRRIFRLPFEYLYRG